jgi:hypothetical protein
MDTSTKFKPVRSVVTPAGGRLTIYREEWVVFDADKKRREQERNLEEIENHKTDVWDD